MSAIKAALAAIDALELGEKINYTEISNQYGVVQSTLTRRHQRLSTITLCERPDSPLAEVTGTTGTHPATQLY
jgi:hypothetical protein